MGVPLALAAGVLAGGCGVVRLAWFGQRARRASRMSAAAVPFERIAPRGSRTLLVVGDSLSVGVGAADPTRSVAGRFAAACPGLSVVNRARCGARIADVPHQIRAAPGKRYDAVLISIGGNDALAWGPQRALHSHALPAVIAARRVAPRVVVTSSANLGAVPIVPWPLTRVLERRSGAVRDVLSSACATADTQFVDFHRPLATDPFSRAPEFYFGDDGVHPSSACYELCFRVIALRTGLLAHLSEPVDAP
jgi:lysophospholipase L1-like esterase